jgi:cytochrome c biogenesis protein CcmG/thiol:disulfide interchange protein DsbE
MTRYLIPLGVFIIIVGFLAIGLKLDPRLVPSPLIDKPVPQFTLPEVKAADETVDSADLRGKVSLLNVWASWCVSCREEHPLLVELSRSGRATIYGLNYKDRREDAIRWLDYYGDPYIASAHDFEGKVGIDFGVYGVPETFVVDRNGVIRYKHIGPISKETLEQRIMPLLQELEKAKS